MEGRQTVWLDCDPGLDDTFAIIYAAQHPQLHLLGVSTSPGNTSLQNTTRNALDVLYNVGRSDVPVFVGSNQLLKGEMTLAEHMHGSNGLGGVQLPPSPAQPIRDSAFQQIFERLQAHPGQVIWCNTGSFTNLCILLLTYPQLRTKIEKIVAMGGAVGKGNITPAAEFNVYFDAHACEQVLRLKGSIPLVLIPLQVTHQNQATGAVFEHFRKQEAIPFAKACLNMLSQFKEMYYHAYRMEWPPIHDPLTVFYLVHPEELEVKAASIVVDTCSASYGRTNVYFESERSPGVTAGKQQWVATALLNQHTPFWQEMLGLLDKVFSQQVQGTIHNQ